MGWPSKLTYREIRAMNVERSVGILACYGDVQTAADLFASHPELADDPEALASAAGNGHEAFVRLLLRHQPDLARRVAVVARRRELTELLFQHGMDPNLPNWLGLTPLHRFAEQGDVEKAALFIDHGADLEACDEEFRSTPLGHAARSGKTRMAEFLLRRGARPDLPVDPPWAWPVAWAKRRGHQEIARLVTEFAQSGTLPARRLVVYDSLANDLVQACAPGDEGALRRIAEHFNVVRRLTWDRPSPAVRVARLRRFVAERLGTESGAATEETSPTLEAARLLIARSEGFESWPHLVKEVGEPAKIGDGP
jgi:hypothetical protein